ncbi:hypothetical protein HYPSUDRAFT_1083859 [Hypholoma sublateritium FD-334 SS-4]|uniref:Uncharacterized protein n=1 Tax=Hypholoma sublateritium (strain FD-334 SS-4) TaxID=945553 RepID=A0A0D2PSZ3_HYPSF|nr:hypothetical protein HYPSUDRAFT_1083859 [Hypholoma sublateritium FD-334 SS-4]
MASAWGVPAIVINTKNAALDLLGSRTTFASKPKWPMAELIGRQSNVGFTYYGERLKRFREVLRKPLNIQSISLFWGPYLEEQSYNLCQSLFKDSEQFYALVEINIQELIVMLTYGYRPDSQYLKVYHTMMRETGEALQPGRWAVNYIPALKWVPAWFPGAGFQAWVECARLRFTEVARTPFYKTKSNVLLGQGNTCFVQQALESLPERHSTDDEDIVMFAAGSLLSELQMCSFIYTFIFMMATHSDIQSRAHEEIIGICGSSSLPGPPDRAQLPFVECIIQEVHRINPAVPLVPHSNSQEADYAGYRIPKNSWIIANIWGMLHDDGVYLQPQSFIPERFLSNENDLVQPGPRNLVYGFGPRRCPGENIADLYLFLVTSRILALFEISCVVEEGNCHIPTLEFDPGIAA